MSVHFVYSVEGNTIILYTYTPILYHSFLWLNLLNPCSFPSAAALSKLPPKSSFSPLLPTRSYMSLDFTFYSSLKSSFSTSAIGRQRNLLFRNMLIFATNEFQISLMPLLFVTKEHHFSLMFLLSATVTRLGKSVTSHP